MSDMLDLKCVALYYMYLILLVVAQYPRHRPIMKCSSNMQWHFRFSGIKNTRKQYCIKVNERTISQHINNVWASSYQMFCVFYLYPKWESISNNNNNTQNNSMLIYEIQFNWFYVLVWMIWITSFKTLCTVCNSQQR
jgi:hypothetical protein